jgi:mRNA interferase HicA
VKRTDLIRHLIRFGCLFLREGGGHTLFINPRANKQAAVPRHTEISNPTARDICKQLGIPDPLKHD